MTSPAPQPAPLRPGQRAAKPAKAKPLTPRQRAALALLAKPGAEIIGLCVVCGGECMDIDAPTIRQWIADGYADWNQDALFCITPAGRAALRAGSRGGGRGRRR